MSMSRCPADTFLAYTYGEFTLFCPMCLYQRGLDKRHKRLSVSTAPQTTSSKMSIQLNEHLSEAVSTKADIWHRKCNTPGHFSPVTMNVSHPNQHRQHNGCSGSVWYLLQSLRSKEADIYLVITGTIKLSPALFPSGCLAIAMTLCAGLCCLQAACNLPLDQTLLGQREESLSKQSPCL